MIFIYFFIIYFFYYLYNKFHEKISTVSNKNINLENYTDKYSKNKIPKDINTIIIGSGISGLVTGGLLSLVGKKVLVLEKHYLAGGCLHSFIYNNVEHETGVHYVGNISKRQKILDAITDKKIKWNLVGHDNNDIYDVIHINGKSYNLRKGKENFKKQMKEYFPNDSDVIDEYLELVEKVAKMDFLLNIKLIDNNFIYRLLKQIYLLINLDYIKYTYLSTYYIISSMTCNKELIAVLCGQFGNYGLPPKESNFFIHANIVNHYLNGGYYPEGGTSNIADQIIKFICKKGGKVLVSANVEKVLIDNNKCIGVKMKGGYNIYSKNVVSSIGFKNTFNKLIKHEKYSPLVNNFDSSVCLLYVFINLKGKIEDYDIKSSNVWYYEHNDFDTMMKEYYNDYTKPSPIFISSSSAKDLSWNKNSPNNCYVCLLTPVKKEWFEEWDNNKSGKREYGYEELKDYFALKLFICLNKMYPKTLDMENDYIVGSPLTSKFYLNSFEGEAYGLNSDINRLNQTDMLRPKTLIDNFYLTGQDICTLGFTGAFMSGVLTSHSILGYGKLENIIFGKNIFKDNF